MADGWIEVLVAGSIGAGAFVSLPDSTRSVDERFVEAAFVRLVWFLVSEVPFPEYTGSIAGGCQNLWQGGRLESHALALQDGMSDTVLQRMPAGHKGGAGRGAGGTDEEPREPGALVVQGIQVRRIYPRMPMTTHGSVALVIRHHQNNVGFFAEG